MQCVQANLFLIMQNCDVFCYIYIYTCTWGYRALPQPFSSSCIQVDEAPQGCVVAVVQWESTRSGVKHATTKFLSF